MSEDRDRDPESKKEIPRFDPTTKQHIEWEVSAWQKTIEVQQHFNDIELRLRNLAVGVVLTVVGAAGLSLHRGIRVTIGGRQTLLAVWLLAAGLVAWLAFYFMDRFWYHRFLKGAVENSLEIEDRLSTLIPDLRLSHEIDDASPISLFGKKIHSTRKVDLFYGLIAALLFLLILLLWFGGGVAVESAAGAN
jgi:small-conductance mechanosensitive channel